MEQNRWQQIGTIVDEALALGNPEERTALIQERCGNDDALENEVIDWLDSIIQSRGMWDELLLSNRVLMEDMTMAGAPAPPGPAETLPEKIGLYKINQRLGRGGMGDVYLAERTEGQFHKQVALKVSRSEVGSTEQVRRFLQERSLLSRLNHPNIARLLDGGVSGDGRPYYVMEYVDGLPLTEYCKKHNCTLDEQLALFEQVCKAVQYAHTNFIVHRDLKPDNLLVTKEGSVKVLDFGIAKLLDQELSEQTLMQTRAGQRLLSLHYAAPEQITMEPVTAATDVYALGLLLYELLADARPFDLKNKKLLEAEQIIRNQEPEKPSVAAGSWQNKIKGDLDAIVMKALRKEPEQRYESASRLLEDVERYRKNQPVQARKGTLRYRAGKFVRRNKAVIIAAAFFILAAVGFGSYHVYQLSQERDIAQIEVEKAEQTAQFLTGLFNKSNPQRTVKANMTAREILDTGAKDIYNELGDQPEVKARILAVVAEAYLNLEIFRRADSLSEQGIKIHQQLNKNPTAELANLQLIKAKAKRGLSEFEEAEQLGQVALIGFKKTLGENAPETKRCELFLSELRHITGTADGTEANIKKWSPEVPINQKDSVANNLLEEAHLAYIKNKSAIAEKKNRQALAIYQDLYGEVHSKTAIAMERLSSNLMSAKNYSVEAESLVRKSISINNQIFDEVNNERSSSIMGLGQILMIKGDYSEAELQLRKSTEMAETVNSKDSPFLIPYYLLYGDFLIETNRLKEAEKLFVKQEKEIAKQYGPNYLFTIRCRERLGIIYHQRNQLENARTIFLSVIEDYKAKYGENSVRVAFAQQHLAHVLLKLGEIKKAETNIEKSMRVLKQTRSKQKWKLAVTERTLGLLRMEQQRFKEAEELLKKSYNFFEQTRGPKSNYTKESLEKLIQLYKVWNKPDKLSKYQAMVSS
jgi:serine/threonine-protein kinase